MRFMVTIDGLVNNKKHQKIRTPLGFRLSSKGFILLVGVSFCIKAIAQRH